MRTKGEILPDAYGTPIIPPLEEGAVIEASELYTESKASSLLMLCVSDS